jgi:hypothetical protein
MGARYNVNRTGIALNTAQDSLTITAPAGRSLKIWRIKIGGEGTASASNEILVQRSTAGTTPTAMTPAPTNPDYAAATFTVATGWATHPTPTANTVLERLEVNSNGGVVMLSYSPGQEIDVPGGGQISFRAAAGTGTVAIHCQVEQI